MAIYKHGMNYSQDSEELIADLKQDIKEFGPKKTYYAFFKLVDDVKLYTNYDIIEPDVPLTSEEIKDGEKVEILTAEKLLERLEKQNSTI